MEVLSTRARAICQGKAMMPLNPKLQSLSSKSTGACLSLSIQKAPRRSSASASTICLSIRALHSVPTNNNDKHARMRALRMERLEFQWLISEVSEVLPEESPPSTNPNISTPLPVSDSLYCVGMSRPFELEIPQYFDFLTTFSSLAWNGNIDVQSRALAFALQVLRVHGYSPGISGGEEFIGELNSESPEEVPTAVALALLREASDTIQFPDGGQSIYNFPTQLFKSWMCANENPIAHSRLTAEEVKNWPQDQLTLMRLRRWRALYFVHVFSSQPHLCMSIILEKYVIHQQPHTMHKASVPDVNRNKFRETCHVAEFTGEGASRFEEASPMDYVRKMVDELSWHVRHLYLQKKIDYGNSKNVNFCYIQGITKNILDDYNASRDGVEDGTKNILDDYNASKRWS